MVYRLWGIQEGSIVNAQLQYLMVLSADRAVLQPGVCGALQAKYWKAASPGPISDDSSVRRAIMLCAAGGLLRHEFDHGFSCETPRELDHSCS